MSYIQLIENFLGDEESKCINEGLINKIQGKNTYKKNKEYIDECVKKATEIISKKKYCKVLHEEPSFDWYNKTHIEFRVYIGTISILELYKDVYKDDPKNAGEKGGKYPKLREELEKFESELNDLFKGDGRVKVLIDYMHPESYFYNWDEADWNNLYEDLISNPWRDVHDLAVQPDIDLIFTFKK